MIIDKAENYAQYTDEYPDFEAIYEFIKYEIPVAVPFGDNERYDLIAEFNEKLNRIQVKYCDYWNSINAVTCPCSSSTNHTALRKERETYINDIDFFVFYIPKKALYNFYL